MHEPLPVAIYGKRLDRPSAIPEGYRILCHHQQFDLRAREAVKQAAEECQWRPSSRRHETCFVLSQLAGRDQRLVLMRLLDLGEDDQGRPHCLRIEAALVNGSASDQWLAGVAQTTAWPAEPLPLNSEPAVMLSEGPPSPVVLEQIRQLRAHGTSGLVRLGVCRELEQEQPASDGAVNVPVVKLAGVRGGQGSSSTAGRTSNWRNVGLVLLLIGGGIGWLEHQRAGQRESDRDDFQGLKDDLTRRIDALEQKLEQWRGFSPEELSNRIEVLELQAPEKAPEHTQYPSNQDNSPSPQRPGAHTPRRN